MVPINTVVCCNYAAEMPRESCTMLSELRQHKALVLLDRIGCLGCTATAFCCNVPEQLSDIWGVENDRTTGEDLMPSLTMDCTPIGESVFVDVRPINSRYDEMPNRSYALFWSCGVMLTQVPTVVEALVKGPWDPDGAIWGRQLDMALEVRSTAREPT